MKIVYILILFFLLLSLKNKAQTQQPVAKKHASQATATSISKKTDEAITSISPDPSTGFLEINFHEHKNEWISYYITDTNGKVIYNDSFFEDKNGYTIALDLSKEPKGLYMVEISSGSEKNYKKIVIE